MLCPLYDEYWKENGDGEGDVLRGCLLTPFVCGQTHAYAHVADGRVWVRWLPACMTSCKMFESINIQVDPSTNACDIYQNRAQTAPDICFESRLRPLKPAETLGLSSFLKVFENLPRACRTRLVLLTIAATGKGYQDSRSEHSIHRFCSESSEKSTSVYKGVEVRTQLGNLSWPIVRDGCPGSCTPGRSK